MQIKANNINRFFGFRGTLISYLYTYIFPNAKLHIDFGDNKNKTKLMPDMYRCIFKTQQVKLGILTGKRILGSVGNSYCIQN